MNANQKALFDAIWKSHFYPGANPAPAVEVEIDGKTFRAEHTAVNRKCYDFMPTPTLRLKLNGKRISREAAFALLA